MSSRTTATRKAAKGEYIETVGNSSCHLASTCGMERMWEDAKSEKDKFKHDKSEDESTEDDAGVDFAGHVDSFGRRPCRG
jgi:hypothetical protein